MAQILTLPKSTPLSTTGGLMAGAKLYTYLTGTSTPQSVYTDYALSVAHANPVVADSNGVFPVMYWGNTNRYRLTLKTSADVTLWTVDDCGPDTASGLGVPSLAGSNTFTGTWNKEQAAEVRHIFDETDAGTDKRLWDIDINAGVLKIRTRTDADGSGKDVLTVTRGSTTAISSIDIGNATDAPTITLNGTAYLTNGSFVSTMGGGATSPNASVKYSRAWNSVTLYFPTISATSNSTSFTMDNLPAALRPASSSGSVQVPHSTVQDNGATVGDVGIVINTTATMTFTRAGSSTGWTASGTKGISGPFSVTYLLT